MNTSRFNLFTFATETLAMLAFILIIFSAPALIQTEVFSDECGWGFVNSTFGGGWYFDNGECN